LRAYEPLERGAVLGHTRQRQLVRKQNDEEEGDGGTQAD
jgi:hypothetical protein